MVVKKQRPVLKIDKHLPQIIVPQKPQKMFIDWWNSDIRFEKTIPHSFDAGYIIIDFNYKGKTEKYLKIYGSEYIKQIAKAYGTTYRNAENMLIDFIESVSKFTVHFKFTEETAMFLKIYDNTDQLFSTVDFAIGESGAEPEIDSIDYLDRIEIVDDKQINNTNIIEKFNIDDLVQTFSRNIMYFIVTILWYIATTSKNTKYIYEKKTPIVAKRHKNVVKVSSTKTITTPIYDLNKIRVVKVDSLTTRKKGWTYSHSFQVHGHYRHYKNGKVIFIKPFIKGKDKEFQQQTITINPKKL